jgi:pilus assembly protein CpaE
MMEKIRVLVVDDVDDVRRSIVALLELDDTIEVAGEAENGKVALEKAARLHPDIILMDVNMPVMDGITCTERMSTTCPKSSVIIVSVQGENDYLRRAMLAGAKEYVVKPFTTEELVETIKKVYVSETRKRSTTQSVLMEDHFVSRAKVFSLISSKGGVGKTTIGTNLAVALQRHKKRVVFVDFDVQFGDAALVYNLNDSRRNLYQLVRDISEMDADLVEKYLILHESGVKVLPAPQKPEEGEMIGVHHVHRVVEALRENYDFIVLDTAPTMNDLFFSILDVSDFCFLVNVPSLSILKNNRALLDVLQKLNYGQLDIRVVLNRDGARNGIRQRDVERVLEREIYWEMANDFRFVEMSINEGVPFVMKDSKNKLSRQIELLSMRLVNEERRQPAARRWLWRFGT